MFGQTFIGLALIILRQQTLYEVYSLECAAETTTERIRTIVVKSLVFTRISDLEIDSSSSYIYNILVTES